MAHDLLCIGHRGAVGHAPENSLASFARALELGAPCVELDVQLVEGELLVFHDERLERTTSGTGFLQESSFAYVRSLATEHGGRIATLEEVLALIDRRAAVNIELKGEHTEGPVAALLEVLGERGWANEQFLVSSFRLEQLQALRARLPQLRLGVLSEYWQDVLLRQAREVDAYSINLALDAVQAAQVDSLRASNLRLLVYTANEPDEIETLRALGVDGVFTDFPERVLLGNTRCFVPAWP